MTLTAPLSLDDFKQPNTNNNANRMVFSQGFGAAGLFRGDDKHAPRLYVPSTFLEEHSMALSVGVSAGVPDQPMDFLATVHLGSALLCVVRETTPGEWTYQFPESRKLNGDLSLLTAQISAMVHEAIEAKARYNPTNYAGTIPLGVSQ